MRSASLSRERMAWTALVLALATSVCWLAAINLTLLARESGLVTRCAWCGRFRDGGRWVVVDPAQASVEQAEITHGICGDCVEALRAAGMSV